MWRIIRFSNNLLSKFEGIAEIEDLKTVKSKDADGKNVNVVISRTCEIKLIDELLTIFLDGAIYASWIFYRNLFVIYFNCRGSALNAIS